MLPSPKKVKLQKMDVTGQERFLLGKILPATPSCGFIGVCVDLNENFPGGHESLLCANGKPLGKLSIDSDA